LNGAVFESVGFEMKEGFASGLINFVEAWCNAILFYLSITVDLLTCSTFYKLPESKSPVK